MLKSSMRRITIVGMSVLVMTLAFITQNVYAGVESDDCERSKDICTPLSGTVCYYWMDEPGLPCIMSEYEYIDKNDNDNEQGDVNR